MTFVNLVRTIKGMLGIKPNRDERRDQRLAKIRELGFKIEDRSGTYQGQVASRRYFLTSPSGKVLDNEGSGYASSSEAFRAAMAELHRSPR